MQILREFSRQICSMKTFLHCENLEFSSKNQSIIFIQCIFCEHSNFMQIFLSNPFFRPSFRRESPFCASAFWRKLTFVLFWCFVSAFCVRVFACNLHAVAQEQRHVRRFYFSQRRDLDLAEWRVEERASPMNSKCEDYGASLRRRFWRGESRHWRFGRRRREQGERMGES